MFVRRLLTDRRVYRYRMSLSNLENLQTVNIQLALGVYVDAFRDATRYRAVGPLNASHHVPSRFCDFQRSA